MVLNGPKFLGVKAEKHKEKCQGHKSHYIKKRDRRRERVRKEKGVMRSIKVETGQRDEFFNMFLVPVCLFWMFPPEN